MIEQTTNTEQKSRESFAADQFLDNPNPESFAALFKVFNPQLLSFFRARTREASSAEDLAQDVMLTVYAKAGQVRERTLFRAWLFKIAHNALCSHYAKLTKGGETVSLTDVEHGLTAAKETLPSTPTFEFRDWMNFLNPLERQTMILRFVEEWEYHEIAAAQAVPTGTVQWRIFNCKKKLRKVLNSPRARCSSRSDRKWREENMAAVSAN